MRSRFIITATSARQFPNLGLPEVAFVGRSNVGKSTLLNKVAQANVARTSRTPGRTQAVNFFEVEGPTGAFVLADLPGYGYAKAPKDLREAWYALIEAYLGARGPLRLVLLLQDLRRDTEEEDLDVYRWLVASSASKPKVLVVATKADKLPKAQRKPARARIAKGFSIPPEEVLLTSSDTGEGIDALRSTLEAVLGA